MNDRMNIHGIIYLSNKLTTEMRIFSTIELFMWERKRLLLHTSTKYTLQFFLRQSMRFKSACKLQTKRLKIMKKHYFKTNENEYPYNTCSTHIYLLYLFLINRLWQRNVVGAAILLLLLFLKLIPVHLNSAIEFCDIFFTL